MSFDISPSLSSDDDVVETLVSEVQRLRSDIERAQKRGGNGGGLNGSGLNGSLKWVAVLFALVVGWLSWVSVTLIGIDKDIAVINGNRFTAHDAVLMRQSIEANIPPAWFLRDFEALESRVDEHMRSGHE